MAAAVDMRGKFYAFIRYLTHGRQGKDLEPAAIGKDRPVPVHKRMQTAGLSYDVVTGPQVKMVGVGEDDLGTYLFQFFRRHGLYRSAGTDRHEDRREHVAVRRVQDASSAVLILML